MERLGKNLSNPRLETLRRQLDPHFLFNALNTISAEVSDDPRLARQMIGHLGDLLRSSVELRDKQEVTLGEELDLLNHFIAIQKARFGDELRVEILVRSELRAMLVPSFLLQPLLENAIHHGIASRPGGGAIVIEARQVINHMIVSVADDGVGLKSGWTDETGFGLGLTLTAERIAGLYPNTRAKLTIRRCQTGGTEVSVLLPLRTEHSLEHA